MKKKLFQIILNIPILNIKIYNFKYYKNNDIFNVIICKIINAIKTMI